MKNWSEISISPNVGFIYDPAIPGDGTKEDYISKQMVEKH